MRFNRALFAAAGVAGLMAVTGSAFTASNTMPTNAGTAGFGSVTASGITVSGIEYLASTTDSTKLDKIKVKTADANATSMTGSLSIKDGSDVIVVGAQGCGAGVSDGGTPATYIFTCDPTTDPDMAKVVKVGFTATRNAS